MAIPDETFAQLYLITSTTGRVYSRTMLLGYITRSRSIILRAYNLTRSDIATVLNDHAFMRPQAGTIPARVADAAIEEAYHRKSQRPL